MGVGYLNSRMALPWWSQWKWLIIVSPLHLAIDSQASRVAASSSGCFSCSLPKRIRKFDGYLEDKMTPLYECINAKKREKEKEKRNALFLGGRGGGSKRPSQHVFFFWLKDGRGHPGTIDYSTRLKCNGKAKLQRFLLTQSDVTMVLIF